MIIPMFLAEAEEAAGGSPLEALGVNGSAFIIQLITFVFVFFILKKFAFTPIVNLLEKRRKVIEDGVKLGQKMEKEQEQIEAKSVEVIRDARQEADRIISDGQKEARDIIHAAEKSGKTKIDSMIKDTEERISEESEQAKRRLEKEIAGLVSEATEVVVEEKMNPKVDGELIDKAVKGQLKK